MRDPSPGENMGARASHIRVSHAIVVMLVAALGTAVAGDGSAGPTGLQPPAVFDRPFPAGPNDLQTMQRHVRRVIARVSPATVMIRTETEFGSGAIVTADGYVLTVAHVAGVPGAGVTVILPDGRACRGKVLGVDRRADMAVVRILQGGDFPFVEMGHSATLKPGDWCLALGYPGSFKEGRRPVVSLGRILMRPADRTLASDCAIEGGDSGGPLVDMSGALVGVHHAAGQQVAVDLYRASWDRLRREGFIDEDPDKNRN